MKNTMRIWKSTVVFPAVMLLGMHLPSPVFAAQKTDETEEKSAVEKWLEKIPWQWGGHVKARADVSMPDDTSVFEPVGTGTLFDGDLEARIKNKIDFADWGYFETHYEIVLSGGGLRHKQFELARRYPALFEEGLLYGEPVNDDRRLMDLTSVIDEGDDHVLYHRLDRLNLTLQPSWGTVRLGRQVITWGNGMVFNPMDLFNPYAPTDVERDYKTGDDMVFAEIPTGNIGNLQMLYVPRRNPVSEDVQWDQSSLAGKFHADIGHYGLDAMASVHYEDIVLGFGATGDFKGGTWRINVTWTDLEDESLNDDYLSLVANYDLSWKWFGKNFYGFVEYYFNGLGDTDYEKAGLDTDITERISRGELFVLGRHYLSGTINVEVHPLVNVYVTVINNMSDPSGVIQPRAIVSLSQNMEARIGGSIYYGGKGTEYGGYRIPGYDLYNKTPNDFFVWLFYYF